MPKSFWRTPLLVLLLSACAPSQPKYVPVPQSTPCEVRPMPTFPAVSPDVCDERVCLTPADSDAIWLWARDVERWGKEMRTCGG